MCESVIQFKTRALKLLMHAHVVELDKGETH